MNPKQELSLKVQRAICDLLAPLGSDAKCLGIMCVVAWGDSEDGSIIAGVNLPAKTEETRQRISDYMVKLATGQMGVHGEHFTAAPEKSS